MPSLPHPRFAAFLLIFALTGGLALSVLPPERALIGGFDLAALVFIFSCVPLWTNDSAGAVRKRAARDDGGRILLLLVTAATFITVLASTAIMLSSHSDPGASDLALSLATIVIAWVFANLVFTFHYSHLFYDQCGATDRRGLDFPGTDEPSFADFCYFAFIIGMTCQVSDVAISDRTMRKAATAHGVTAFFFNLGVLALAVNITASIL
jgi:uncharacterized membrane protein